ncbi:MAG: ATP-binding protein [Armatimonadetes bacterium]|nr:ATP-binding protein [Armatimonadota bacterium]
MNDDVTIGIPEYDYAEPRADSMAQSLRAVGYDLPTAISDLIDNSISASATNVWLDFHWDGDNSTIAVIDDGHGMTEGALIEAMRLGSTSPEVQREPSDLGRFGLGLKTASFSQCRRLTVSSKPKGGALATRCWDLDYITACCEWRLQRTASERAAAYIQKLDGLPCGTIVVWENADRIVSGTDRDTPADQALFYANADAVREHLAMVFHRFLAGARALRIHVNGTAVVPWDPFLTRDPATQLLAEEALAVCGTRLVVKPYVLPHHSKASPEVYRGASGIRGWNMHQGFYVYRNKRLLVAGDWLGLGYQREEHYKLARIMLDIPNWMDADWQIDIKKSRAYPPPTIRRELRRIANITRARASDVYRYRGARIVRGVHEMVFLWDKRVKHGRISYTINRDHPVVKSALQLPGEAGRIVRTLLPLIEETVPIPTITLDAAESPDKHSTPFEHTPSALRTALEETYRLLRSAGLSRGEAKVRLMNLEPFNLYPDLVAALDDIAEQED